MTISEIQQEVHQTAKEHGWWEGPPSFPEGIPSELADVVIRVLDYCEAAGIDLEQEIIIKNEFNKTRPYKHGGKVI